MAQTNCNSFNATGDMLSKMSDEELAEKCSEANNQAAYISELVVRYFAFIKKKAGEFCSLPANYDDLVQEGMLGFMNAVKHFDENRSSKFSSFAYSCVVNRIKTAASKQNMDCECSDNSEQGEDIFNPESMLIRRELLTSMEKSLSSREYSIFRLYMSGLSYSEIADKMSISSKSVDNAVQRVRRKLRAELDNI